MLRIDCLVESCYSENMQHAARGGAVTNGFNEPDNIIVIIHL